MRCRVRTAQLSRLGPFISSFLARSSFDSLRTTGMNQTIVLTGESGSGKTVCNNRLLQYFCNTTSPIKSLETVTIDDKLIAAAPLFSAFGNAKVSTYFMTIRPNNDRLWTIAYRL